MPGATGRQPTTSTRSPRQAQRRAEPEIRGRARGLPAPRALDEHPSREQPARCDGRARAWLWRCWRPKTHGSFTASISRVGQTGPAQQGRLRSGRAGRLGHHVRSGRARRAAPCAHGPRRRPLRARRHPRRARASSSHGARDSTWTRRSWTPASRCRSGGDGVSFAGGIPAALGSAHRLSAPYQAVPLRRRLHHARRGERAIPAALRRPRPPGVGRRAGVHGQREPRRAPRGARGAHRGHHVRGAARVLARAARGARRHAGRSTTTRRCSPIHRSSRERWSSRPSDAQFVWARLASPVN